MLPLPLEVRTQLLRIAREAVSARVRAEPPPGLSFVETGCGGAFVTLRVGETLRGCIGRLSADQPLADTVQIVAAAAAAEDPRFPPVREDELTSILIEVSVLGPLEPCDGPHHVEIGRHGLVVERGGHRGVLLPQVAVEWGWDGAVFLEQTCVKAGLDGDAWRRDATVFRFEADVLTETT